MGQDWSEDIFGSAMPNEYWQMVKSKILVGFCVINYSLETPTLHDPYIYIVLLYYMMSEIAQNVATL